MTQSEGLRTLEVPESNAERNHRHLRRIQWVFLLPSLWITNVYKIRNINVTRRFSLTLQREPVPGLLGYSSVSRWFYPPESSASTTERRE